MGQALEAVAAADAAADAAGGAADGPPQSAATAGKAAATLALEIVGKDSAKLTLKEVKSLGAVDLAVVTLPAVTTEVSFRSGWLWAVGACGARAAPHTCATG